MISSAAFRETQRGHCCYWAGHCSNFR